MGVEIDAVLDIEVADEAIITRMSGRRVCESCGSSYHVLYKQPKEEGKCEDVYKRQRLHRMADVA